MACGKRRKVEWPHGGGDGAGPTTIVALLWEDSASAFTSRANSSSCLRVLRAIRRGGSSREAGDVTGAHRDAQVTIHAAHVSSVPCAEEASSALFSARQLDMVAYVAQYRGRMSVIFNWVLAMEHEKLKMECNDLMRCEDDKVHRGVSFTVEDYLCSRYGLDHAWAHDAINGSAEHVKDKHDEETTCFRAPSTFFITNLQILGTSIEEQRLMVFSVPKRTNQSVYYVGEHHSLDVECKLKASNQINLTSLYKQNCASGPKLFPCLVKESQASYDFGNCDCNTRRILDASGIFSHFVERAPSKLQNTLFPDEIMGADDGDIEECANSRKIDCYIYKQFQHPMFRTLHMTWRKKLFHGINILPAAKMQGKGECSYYATIVAMESHFKAAYAVHWHNDGKEFNVTLSAEHLKQMVEEHYVSKEGLRGRQRLEICLKMAKLYGVMSEKDYNAGKESRAKAKRYKIKSYWPLSTKEKKQMSVILDKGETTPCSFG